MTKKRMLWIGVIIVFSGLLAFPIFRFVISPCEEFYPSGKTSALLQKTRNYFSHQQYLDLTSFVNQVLISGNYAPKERQELLFWEAESYFQLEQYDLAKEQFTSLVNQNPTFWQGSLRLIAIKILLKQPGDFLKQIRKLPRSQERDYWMGRFYETRNKIDEALKTYRKISSTNSLARWRLGSLLFQKGDYSSSLPLLEDSLRDKRISRFDLLKMLFRTSVELKDRQRATKYSNALKIYLANNPALIREIVQDLIALGEVQQARRIFLVLDIQAPLIPEFAEILADLNYQLQNYSMVVRYSRYLSLAIDKVYLHLLDAYAHLNQNEKLLWLSKKDKQKRSEKIQSQVFLYRAHAYEELGNRSSAIKEREKFAQLNPQESQNLWKLLDLYERNRQVKKIQNLTPRLATLNPERFPDIMKLLFRFSLFAKAQEIIDALSAQQRNHEEILFWEAKIQAAQRNWDKLEEVLSYILKMSPKDRTVAYYTEYSLGNLKMRKGDYSSAVGFLEAASQIQSSPSLTVKLALACLLEGNASKAEELIGTIEDRSVLSDEEKGVVNKIIREVR